MRIPFKLKVSTTTYVLLPTFSCASLRNGHEAKSATKLDYNVNMLLCYGQSLSVAGGATNAKCNFRNIISFPGGCNEWGSKVNINDPKSAADFYGNDFVFSDSLSGKRWPPVAAVAVSWMNLLERENNVDLEGSDGQFLLSTIGFSGVTIEKLAKDTELYQRLLLGVRKGNKRMDYVIDNFCPAFRNYTIE